MSHELKSKVIAEMDEEVARARALTNDPELLAPIRALRLAYDRQIIIEAPLNPRQLGEGVDVSQEFAAVAASRGAIKTALVSAVASLAWKLHWNDELETAETPQDEPGTSHDVQLAEVQ